MSTAATILAAGVGGIGVGIGLVIGAWAVRHLRRYMDEE